MTLEALPAGAARVSNPQGRRGILARFDASALLFAICALILLVLVGLPLFWLAVSAFTDKAGAPSLTNFKQLFTDPTLLAPLQISLTVATCVGVLSTLIAAPIAWLVARSDMPARRIVRALITASFVTPPFLGAIAWEVLAAPNSGLINVWYRGLYDLPPFVEEVGKLVSARPTTRDA